MGFSDDRFALPELRVQEHVVKARTKAEGMLFDLPAVGLHEQREEQRRTIQERCERVASLVNDTGRPAVVWCHLNDEGNLLEKLIPNARQVKGADTYEAKEDAFLAFRHGQARVLVTKPKIGAWGLNWQHCAHMAFFPSHSFESYYQAVRRCWRFGQERSVTVDIVTTESGSEVMKSLQRKATQAEGMFSSLMRHMNDALHLARQSDFTKQQELPSWL